MLLLQEEKKGKKEKITTNSESDMLTTLPSMHMALTRDQAQNACG